MKKYAVISGIFVIALLATVTFADSTQKSPTACTAGWTSCNGAFANGGTYAMAVTSGISSDWYNYGFNINNSSIISNIVVRADYWGSKIPTYINVQVSYDRGITWGPSHVVGGNLGEQSFYIDVTNDFPGVMPLNLTDQSFRVRATTLSVGKSSKDSEIRTMSSSIGPIVNVPLRWYLDWIPVIVNYTSFDFSVSVNPSSGAVMQGNSIQTTVSVNLVGGIPQDVSLSQTGCPPSSTCTFNPTHGIPTYTSTFTVSTSPSTPVGVYPITIYGTGDGKTRNTIYTLNVTSGPQADLTIFTYDFTLTPVSVPIGGEVSMIANVTNIGNANAGPYKVRFYDVTANRLIGYYDISGTLVGQKSPSFKIYSNVSGPVGNHTIEAYADYYNTVAESNEANNVQTKILTVY